MKLMKVGAWAVAFLGFTTAAGAADCDGNLHVTGNLDVCEALRSTYDKHLSHLFSTGTLDPRTRAIRASCDCTMQGSFVYCSASFHVHQCFRGASGTVWFSQEPVVMGKVFATWNASVSDPQSDIQYAITESATKAATDLVLKLSQN
jgi:hypothetical protein